MRLLRDFEAEPEAQQLANALRAHEIESEVTQGGGGRFGVWVLDEEQLERALSLSETWIEGDDPEAYARAATKGLTQRVVRERDAARRHKRMQAAAKALDEAQRTAPPLFTWALLCVCLVLYGLPLLAGWDAFASQFPGLEGFRVPFEQFSVVDVRKPLMARVFSLGPYMVPILPLPWDQPWRLVTPILLHGNLMHIGFNMLLWSSLGSRFELRHGSLQLLVFVLVSAALSNLVQYQLTGPGFSGLSGVIYGLLGAQWMRQRLDPLMHYGLQPGFMQFALIWMVGGFLGGFGMANWCHLIGLLVGLAWGAAGARLGARTR